jgi:uncharacterized Fe-S cluster-containing radical SAM superfamily protein
MLRRRAEIRRQIPSRKSVQEGAPDRISDLLEQAAEEIETLTIERDSLRTYIRHLESMVYGGVSN